MHPSLSHQPLTVTLLSQGQSRVLAQTTATKPSLDNSPDPCNSLFAIRIADRTGFVRVGNVVDPRPPAETDVQIHDAPFTQPLTPGQVLTCPARQWSASSW